MKLITAVVPPAGFERIREALRVLRIPGLTVGEVYGPLGPAGVVQVYRGVRQRLDLSPQCAGTCSPPTTTRPTWCAPSRWPARTAPVAPARYGGHRGEVVRIRTLERGKAAL